MSSPSIPTHAAPFSHPGLGTGCELWLARHGEVHADWQGQAYGNLDVPLGPEGQARSEQLAKELGALNPTHVLSSPLQRAQHMGERVARAAGLELCLDKRLAEIDRGSWQGRQVKDLHAQAPDDVRAFYDDPWNWRGHGGESDSMLAQRVWPAIESGLQRAAGGRLVVTTHYNVIRVLVAGAMGTPAPKSFRLRVDPSRMVVLQDQPGGWHLLYSNILSPALGRPTP